jgi:small subunit ribosomal protein S6
LLARPLQTEGRREELGNVNDYEIMLLLGPDLAEERQNEIVARTRELIEKAGGTWEGQDAWGRRKLAYEIARSEEAFYHVLYFSAPPETLDEVSRVLRITDGVLRHGAYRRTKAQPLGTRPPRPSRSDEAAEYAGSLTDSEEVKGG